MDPRRREELDRVVAAMARRTAAAMKEQATGDVLEVCGHAVRLAESAAFRLRAVVGPPPAVACRAGCAHCCSSAVAVAPPEAFRIAAYLVEALSADELAELRRRLVELAASTAGMTWDQRVALRRPCLFLDADNRCRVYEVRPLTCRAVTSIDPAFCQDLEHSFTAGELDSERFDTQRAGLAGILTAVASQRDLPRLEDALVELQGAVSTALEDPSALAHWLSGDEVFSPIFPRAARPA